MPEPPKQGENRQEFVSRCIAHYVGKENKSQSQASAICFDTWRRYKKGLLSGKSDG